MLYIMKKLLEVAEVTLTHEQTICLNCSNSILRWKLTWTILNMLLFLLSTGVEDEEKRNTSAELSQRYFMAVYAACHFSI